MSDLGISIGGLTELEVLELRSALSKSSYETATLTISKETLPPGRVGDPALLSVAFQIAADNAPTVLPILAVGIAAWIAKGRRKGQLKSWTFRITSGGIEVSSFSAAELQESDASAILPKLAPHLPPSPKP